MAEKAVALKPKTYILESLATAYVSAGRFDKVIITQKKAIALEKKKDNSKELNYFESRLIDFKNQKFDPNEQGYLQR